MSLPKPADRQGIGPPLPLRPRAIPVIDIEASGLGPSSYPIEIGIALPNGKRLCGLVRPAADWTHWDDSAQAMHGISRELLRSRGRPIADICRWLDRELGTITVYSDAWHNDWGWICRLYDAVDRVPRLRVQSLRALLREEELAGWHDAVDAARLKLRQRRHRAAGDAAVLQRAYADVLAATAVAAPRWRLASSTEWTPLTR